LPQHLEHIAIWNMKPTTNRKMIFRKESKRPPLRRFRIIFALLLLSFCQDNRTKIVLHNALGDSLNSVLSIWVSLVGIHPAKKRLQTNSND
jgi:hypothetical protein